jgi:hypothetical protein
MGTEFPEQSLSDLCVHRVSAFKAIVLGSMKSRLTTAAKPRSETRWTQSFENKESDSDLCVHRASVVKAIVLGSMKSRLTTEPQWAQSFQTRNRIQTSAFIVSLR